MITNPLTEPGWSYHALTLFHEQHVRWDTPDNVLFVDGDKTDLVVTGVGIDHGDPHALVGGKGAWFELGSLCIPVRLGESFTVQLKEEAA